MVKSKEGICCICGRVGPLSFEHVPPRAAFNNQPVIALSFDAALQLGPEGEAKGPIQQKGAGGYTLCSTCNNNTGAWYAKSFIAFCYQAMELLNKSGGNPSLIYPFYIYPLQVLKQIITMFFSVNGDEFRIKNEELVRFVLNREARYLSPNYRFFIYYNLSKNLRSSGIVGNLDINTSKITILSEISYPPFGYLMLLDSEPPDKRLIEITHFSRFDYSDFRMMQLKLPVLPTHTVFPGDYREIKQILNEALADSRFAASQDT